MVRGAFTELNAVIAFTESFGTSLCSTPLQVHDALKILLNSSAEALL